MSRLVSPTCAPTMTPHSHARAQPRCTCERADQAAHLRNADVDEPLRQRLAEERQLLAPDEAFVQDDGAVQRLCDAGQLGVLVLADRLFDREERVAEAAQCLRSPRLRVGQRLLASARTPNRIVGPLV